VVRKISVTSRKRNEFIDITDQIQQVVADCGVASGICYAYVPHTTAGIVINEGADPDVVTDILSSLERLVPPGADYQHREGNADAHIKAALVGTSENIIINQGRLMLGTWQHVFFCEFDGPRHREVYVEVNPHTVSK